MRVGDLDASKIEHPRLRTILEVDAAVADQLTNTGAAVQLTNLQ